MEGVATHGGGGEFIGPHFIGIRCHAHARVGMLRRRACRAGTSARRELLCLPRPGGMAKRNAAMCRVRRNMPAPSAWVWHPDTEGLFLETVPASRLVPDESLVDILEPAAGATRPRFCAPLFSGP